MQNPFYRFGLLSFGCAVLGAFALVVTRVLGPPAAWVVAVNLAAFVTYRYDKAVAGGSCTRVPEAVLLLLEAAGGTAGAAAAIWLMRPRHKSRSPRFLAWFFVIALLQALAIARFLWG